MRNLDIAIAAAAETGHPEAIASWLRLCRDRTNLGAIKIPLAKFRTGDWDRLALEIERAVQK